MAQQAGATAEEVRVGVASRLPDRGQYVLDESFLRPPASQPTLRPVRKPCQHGKALLVQGDCMDWLRNQHRVTL